MFRFRRQNPISNIIQGISAVVAIILIWRGVWYVLDDLDILIFGGNHTVSAVLGILLGLLILYIPDKDLKEIHKH